MVAEVKKKVVHGMILTRPAQTMVMIMIIKMMAIIVMIKMIIIIPENGPSFCGSVYT